MKKVLHQLFFLLVILSYSRLCYGQGKYIRFNEVEFDSPKERMVLQSILDDDGSLFDGFLVIASEDSASFEKWKKFYQGEIDEMRGRKIPKKREKDIKFIYDQLHDKFLRKYELLSYFDQIFENGVYNCVTAVALYAMSFDELGIPYGIKETPTHVYIVADPGDTQLLIETTDPISGFKSFSPGFKENFVAQLGMMKVIDQADVAGKGIYAIFDEYYFGGADLTLKQLIGIQYYNRGITAYEEGNYHNAWRSLAKAQLFHTTDQIDASLFASIASVLSGSDYKEWEDIKLLPYLSRFESFDVKQTNVIGEFGRMLSYVLVDRNDVETAEKAFDYFVENTTNENIINEASFVYFYERGRILYNRANYSDAFEFFIDSYSRKPGNANAETMLTESFRLAYGNKSISDALARLDTLLTKNEELQSNNHLNNMRINLVLSKMSEDFQEKRSTSGNEMKELFEQMITENPDYAYNPNLLSDAYSQAAVYYFKRGYTTRAKSILRTGLKYEPNSYQLKTRLRMISN